MRRIPLSRRSHIIGFQPLSSGTTEHESALERDFVTRTGFLFPTATITSQPIKLKFHNGLRWCRYTPDFLVRSASNRPRLIEIKYRSELRTNWRRYQPAFLAARMWAREHGGDFRIVTERWIRDAALENAKRLLPLRQSPLDAKVALKMLATVQAAGGCPLRKALESTPAQQTLALSTVWKLIARQALIVDLHRPITFDSTVRLP